MVHGVESTLDCVELAVDHVVLQQLTPCLAARKAIFDPLEPLDDVLHQARVGLE